MNYPVTTPFGQVAGYPLNNGFHNGIDYGYPMGTPVVVNGVEIGLSNNTGASTGPHLHVGKWVGGKAVDPGVGNGFQFDSAVVFDTGSDPTNGNYVRITGDGALWNYLHLQTILVTKGQVLKGEDMPTLTTAGNLEDLTLLATGRSSQGDPNLKNLIGQDLEETIRYFVKLPEHLALLDRAASSGANAEVLKPGTYKVQ